MNQFGIDTVLATLVGLIYGMIMGRLGYGLDNLWFWVGLVCSIFVINSIFLHFYKE